MPGKMGGIALLCALSASCIGLLSCAPASERRGPYRHPAREAERDLSSHAIGRQGYSKRDAPTQTHQVDSTIDPETAQPGAGYNPRPQKKKPAPKKTAPAVPLPTETKRQTETQLPTGAKLPTKTKTAQ